MTTENRLLGAGVGYTGAGFSAHNYFYLDKYTCLQSGNITELRFYGKVNGNVKVAIYADNAGEPGTRLAYNNSGQSVLANQWNVLSISQLAVTLNTIYWIAFIVDTDSCIGGESSGAVTRYKSATYSTFSFPNPAGSGFTSNTFKQATNAWEVIPTVAPTVATNAADNITESAAKLHGTLTADGGEACTVHFQWGETDAYGTETADQTGKVTNNTFQADIADLDPNTVYHFRSVAHNSAGTSYGDDQEFQTLQHYEAPTATTDPADDVQRFQATLHGMLNNDGNESCTVRFQYGKTDQYGSETSAQAGKHTDDEFQATIDDLDPDTVYHFRAKATNDEGTSHGEDAQLETLPLPPEPQVQTNPAGNITNQTAQLHGTLTGDKGEECDVAFDYGKTDAYGSTTDWQSGKHTDDEFEATIASLDPTTRYHFRAKARHTWATGYGSDAHLDTLAPPPPPREYEKVVIRHPAIKTVAVYQNGQLVDEFTQLSNLDEQRIEDCIEIPIQPPAQVRITTLADKEWNFNLP